MGNPKAYSPFNTLEELKYGIAAMHVFEYEIPNNWISFLIVNSTEDLSTFFRSLNFDLTYKNIIMFNSEGHFYESIKNYEKTPKLVKSYYDACLNKDERTIGWYVWRGHLDPTFQDQFSPSHITLNLIIQITIIAMTVKMI